MTAFDVSHLPLDDLAVTATAPDVDIVIPVYNEAADICGSVRRLHRYLTERMPLSWRITIADNASTDDTWQLAGWLSRELPGVSAIRLSQKGRGRALHAAWGASDATVLAYMDVDLSTDLDALLPLVAPLLSGHSDVAIGTRLTHASNVVRGPKREIVSRSYNAILKFALRTRFSDAQCGFKAIRRERAEQLLPLVEDDGWFFDTELLVLAERAGMRIHEVPVDWIDDPDSRVDIVSTAITDLKGVARVGRGLATGRIPLQRVRQSTAVAEPLGSWTQVIRFAGVGVVSTLAYLVLFLALRQTTSSVAANAIALVVTAIANTAANRRLTFGVHGRAGWWRHQLQGLLVFGVALAVTTGSLGLLRMSQSHPRRAVEAAVLVTANLAATALRFLLLRGWVFATTTTRSL